MSEAKRSAPAAPDPSSSSRAGSSWGTPRHATHLWVLVAALLAGAVAPIGLRHALGYVVAVTTPQNGSLLRSAVEQESIIRRPWLRVVLRQLPPLQSYTVQESDTIPSIASRAGLSVDTVIQVNHLLSGDDLTVGQILIIPPVNGTMVPVRPGETLAQLAAAYRADLVALRSINRLSTDGALPEAVFVPAASIGELAARPSLIAPSIDTRHHLARFIWPTQGTITQYFWQYHPGIDIANTFGTREVAADGGRVVWAGWGSYGIYVEIDHGNGFSTLYAHMSRAVVQAGDLVTAGQLIGLMGATGRATGTHLHFEIRYHGVPQNPLEYLP